MRCQSYFTAMWVSGAKMSSIGESSDLKAERHCGEKLVQLACFADEVIRDSL